MYKYTVQHSSRTVEQCSQLTTDIAIHVQFLLQKAVFFLSRMKFSMLSPVEQTQKNRWQGSVIASPRDYRPFKRLRFTIVLLRVTSLGASNEQLCRYLDNYIIQIECACLPACMHAVHACMHGVLPLHARYKDIRAGLSPCTGR